MYISMTFDVTGVWTVMDLLKMWRQIDRAVTGVHMSGIKLYRSLDGY